MVFQHIPAGYRSVYCRSLVDPGRNHQRLPSFWIDWDVSYMIYCVHILQSGNSMLSVAFCQRFSMDRGPFAEASLRWHSRSLSASNLVTVNAQICNLLREQFAMVQWSLNLVYILTLWIDNLVDGRFEPRPLVMRTVFHKSGWRWFHRLLGQLTIFASKQKVAEGPDKLRSERSHDLLGAHVGCQH